MSTEQKAIRVMPALVLDLDGTVRRTKSGKSFIENLDDIELMPGMEELMWKYRKAGYLILGISNQAGVAHGFKLPDMVMDEMKVMISLFKENPFHTIRQCFNDNKGKIFPYNLRSLCRKPDIGMLALMEYDLQTKGVFVDWDRSLFVGDREDDENCAKSARIEFMYVDKFLIEGGKKVDPLVERWGLEGNAAPKEKPKPGDRCTCECHEPGSNMQHIVACCNNGIVI